MEVGTVPATGTLRTARLVVEGMRPRQWVKNAFVFGGVLYSGQFVEAGPLATAVRATLKPLAPNIAGNELRTLQQLVDKSVSPRRLVVLMLGGFAVFALILASLGIYGLKISAAARGSANLRT